MTEDPKFRAWYMAEFKAAYMPPFENGGYPTSKRAQMAWAAWQAALANRHE